MIKDIYYSIVEKYNSKNICHYELYVKFRNAPTQYNFMRMFDTIEEREQYKQLFKDIMNSNKIAFLELNNIEFKEPIKFKIKYNQHKFIEQLS